MISRVLSLMIVLFLGRNLTLPNAIAQSREASPLDPQNFVTLKWTDRVIAAPRQVPWEVIGRRGTLSIAFDLIAMKRAWEVDTQGSLSIRGHVTNLTGGERKIEVPGYSMIGEQETVFDLDMNSARALVNKLFQGSSFAHRILRYHANAELARTVAEIAAYNSQIRRYLQYLESSEAALRGIYTQALGFTLTYAQLKEAARAIEEAESQLGSLEAELAAARTVEVEYFISRLESDRATLEAYLAEIHDLSNRPYMEILGGIIGKDGQLIRATAVDIAQSLAELNDPNVTDAGRARIKARLIHVAKLLQKLERDQFYKYRHVGPQRRRELEDTPQYQRHMPATAGGGLYEVSMLEYVPDTLRENGVGLDDESMVTVRAQCKEQLPPSPQVSDTLVEIYVNRRIESIRAMVRQIADTGRHAELERDIARKFREQIEPLATKPTELEAAREALTLRFTKGCEAAKATERLVASREIAERITINNEALRVILMIDTIHALIDRIRPTNVSLDELSLKQGDRVVISVSFIPGASDDSPPPPQLAYTFDVQPWGFSGIVPTVRDTLYVVKPSKGENFSVAPAVAAVWNFYGGGSKVKTFWRTFAPGFGFTTTFLNFDQDDATIEFGIGPLFYSVQQHLASERRLEFVRVSIEQ